MAGLIRNEDIATVRERARIDEIVGQHVHLKQAGSGSMKGLCPFHDERSPSFHVRPELGLWHCFGCGEGGDVIAFVQKHDHLSFTEAVEYLASKTGVQLRYTDAGSGRPGESDPGRRQRLLAAHQAASEFYQGQLTTAGAVVARRFLAGRGFTRDHAAQFDTGYAPQGWDHLYRELRRKGFSDADLLAAGLVSQGSRGVYDRFRGRLMWPIKDTTGAVIGFGARKLHDDDPGPKYLNTPETPIYHKSQVLYGLDLAKREIARQRQVVVVEGYTDVMAMHVAGIPTAVATCGTAFGTDHIRMVRRLMGDTATSSSGVILADGHAMGGEVIFTFDGDAAGQKAALRAFEQDQQFATQTFVAVDSEGRDPCDLRLAAGDGALLALVSDREPLFEFALKTALDSVDLNTAEGRVQGLRVAAPVISRIRDRALRGEYARIVAGWLGMDVAAVREGVKTASRQSSDSNPTRGRTQDHGGSVRADSRDSAHRGVGGDGGRPDQAPSPGSDPADELRESLASTHRDPVLRTQRQGLEVALQLPEAAARAGFDDISGEVFSVPALRAVHEAMVAVGGVGRYSELRQGADTTQRPPLVQWAQLICEQAGPVVEPVITELAVAVLPHDDPKGLAAWAMGIVQALRRIEINREIGNLRAQLQRFEADDPESAEVFAALVDLETQRRRLDATTA